MSLHYLSVPLVRGNPAPPLTGLQPVVDPAIFPRSGFGLLLFLLPFMSSYLPTSLAAGSRYYPVTVSGIVSPYGQKPSAAMGTAAGILDGTMPGEALTREQFAVILDKLGLIPSVAEKVNE